MEKQGNNHKNKAAAFGKSLYTNKDRGPCIWRVRRHFCTCSQMLCGS